MKNWWTFEKNLCSSFNGENIDVIEVILVTFNVRWRLHEKVHP